MSTWGGTKDNQYKGVFHKSSLNGKKAQAALALAVSLWIGGSGVAMAEEVVVSSLSDLNSKSGNLGDDKPIIKDGYHYYLNPDKSAKEFRITGEDYTDKSFSGTDTTGNVEGYTLRFYNGNANILVGGSGTTGAKGNHVEIYGGSVIQVYGGRVLAAGSGDVNNNTVTVKGGTVRGWVCGGSGPENACENEVTISGATIGDNTAYLPYVVCGGHVFSDDKYATKNIVNLTNAIIIGNVYGGYGGNLNNVDGITGNTLNLYGVNRVSGNGNVANFEFINIKKAQWSSPVLTSTGSISNGDGNLLPTINAEGLTFDFSTPWSMAVGSATNLIESDNVINANIAQGSNISQHYTVNSANLKNFASGVEVDAAIKGGIAFSADKKTLTYSITANQANKLTFGNVKWKDSGALINHKTTLSNVSFDGAAVDTTKIAFTNKDNLAADSKMTLVSDFGTRVGNIDGTTFKVGKGTGEGHAYYDSGDLLYVVTKEAGGGQPSGDESAINKGGDPISGHVDGDVTGGVARNNGTAADNTKEVLAGSEVTGSVIAAVSENGVATHNVVKVSNATIGCDIIAAQSTSGTVSNGNKAEVNGGSVGGSVYGGKSDSGEVNTNQVIINGAKVSGSVYGGFSQSNNAEANQVEISGAEISGDVYGGKSAKASNNNVINFNGGTAHNLIGGGSDTAVGNIVKMIGGTVKNIYGALADTSATNNQIYLGGGTVDQNVYGGFSDSTNGTTSGNSITLYGTANVSAANLCGGNFEATGNFLNIGRVVEDNKIAWTGGGQRVKNISNFETLNYSVIPWSESTAAVTISDGSASDLSMATVSAGKVAFTNINKTFQNGKMTFLDQSRANKKATSISKESTFTVGTVGVGTGTLSLDDNSNVIYNVKTFEASEQTHNTVMGAEASMAALSAGNDFVGAATEGLSDSGNAGSDGLATYANMGGGSMTVDTGSHVNTHTWNAILALGHKNEKKLSTTEYGAFFEYGTGNYSTFNGDERGDGSTRYTGGILGKWQKNDGFYVEGSLRAGSIHDDASNVLRDDAGNPYSYKTDATYWGAHIGVGKELKLNKTDVLDLYAKYFYNHRGSVSFDAGGHYDLDAVESSVLRLGTRYTVKQNDNINYYGGLAVEHEFAGRASGTATPVGGTPLSIRGADISGTSVRGEIGATFRPGEKSNVTLDLNLSGFAGKKQGLTGGLSAVFHI